MDSGVEDVEGGGHPGLAPSAVLLPAFRTRLPCFSLYSANSIAGSYGWDKGPLESPKLQACSLGRCYQKCRDLEQVVSYWGGGGLGGAYWPFNLWEPICKGD